MIVPGARRKTEDEGVAEDWGGSVADGGIVSLEVTRAV
jgi:hypothetical protein